MVSLNQISRELSTFPSFPFLLFPRPLRERVRVRGVLKNAIAMSGATKMFVLKNKFP
jgi:hypothetical protein